MNTGSSLDALAGFFKIIYQISRDLHKICLQLRHYRVEILHFSFFFILYTVRKTPKNVHLPKCTLGVSETGFFLQLQVITVTVQPSELIVL